MQKMLFPLLTEETSKLPFYVTSVGGAENQEQVFRPNGYTSYHWLHVVSGEGKLQIAGNEYVVSDNKGFFFYPGVPHSYYAVKQPWKTFWVTFDGYGVLKLLNSLKIDKFEVFDINDIGSLNLLQTEIYESVTLDSPFKSSEGSFLLYRFLLTMKNFTNIGSSGRPQISITRLQPLLSYIEINYMKNLSLEDMSAVLNITPQHLCRLFRQSINMRPFEYLTKCRLRKAKEILVGTENSTLSEIAERTGYNDVSYFCATFKEYEGMTPVQFKKMHATP